MGGGKVSCGTPLGLFIAPGSVNGAFLLESPSLKKNESALCTWYYLFAVVDLYCRVLMLRRSLPWFAVCYCLVLVYALKKHFCGCHS